MLISGPGFEACVCACMRAGVDRDRIRECWHVAHALGAPQEARPSAATVGHFVDAFA